MRSRTLRLAGLVPAAVLIVMLFVAPAYAQQSYSSGWYTLGPGQTVEWDMTYPGSSSPTIASTLDVAQSPMNAIRVAVYTDAQWQQLAAGQSPTPIGYGTQMRDTNNNLTYGGDLLWQVGTPYGGLYHLQFTNTTQQPAYYHVMLTGLGAITPYSTSLVGQPGTTPATSPAMAEAAPSSSTASQAPSTLPVTGGSAALGALLAAGLALLAGGFMVKRLRVS